jgi:hypothetical protein
MNVKEQKETKRLDIISPCPLWLCGEKRGKNE